LRGNLDDKSCQILDRQISYAAAQNAYIILELHNYGRRTESGVSHIIGESQLVGINEFSDIWFRIASRWGGNPKIIFALMNEPHDQNTHVLVTVSNAAIASIRRTGTDNLIMVSGNNWNSMGWGKGSENQQYMLQIRDERQNFCFDVHHYFDDWSQGKGPNVRNNPIQSMLDFTTWAKENNKRAFCGEFACSYNKKGMAAARQLLRHIESNKDVFLGWAWWGAGGPWQPDYPFLLDPFASMYSPTNPDPIGSATWQKPVDRPQMKVLQEFLPSNATPFNAWLIEDQSDIALSAFYRRGDFSRQPAVNSVLNSELNGEWQDSGPKQSSAVTIANPPSQRVDGGVYFSSSNNPLECSVLRDKSQESIFSIVSSSSVGTGIQRTVFSSLLNGSAVGPRLAFSGSGQLTTGIQTLPKEVCPVSDRLPLSSPVLVQSRRRPSRQVGNYADVEMNISSGALIKISTIPLPLVSWSQSSTSIIGAKDNNKSDAFDGVIYELAIFNSYLSDENVAKIQGRLHWDCGLAHKLPTGHPYRIKPPSLN
jgi:endoglucanase